MHRPVGCDATVYEHVIELREKHLDQEEALGDFQKLVDDFKRTCDRHCQRKKQIERDLHSHVKELQSLQTEKQQHLNQSLLCHENLQRGSLHVKILLLGSYRFVHYISTKFTFLLAREIPAKTFLQIV